jgi:hypothetical protein
MIPGFRREAAVGDSIFAHKKNLIMNWGYRILFVYGIFVGGMIFLAYQASKQNIELVTEDYYARELVFQGTIDEVARAAALSTPVTILCNDHKLVVTFPKDFSGKEIAGELTLYYPANQKKDLTRPFRLTDKVLAIDLPADSGGLHYVKIGWVVEGVSYYAEKKIIIGT